MCAENRSTTFAAPVRNNEAGSHILLRFYPEVVKYLLEKYAVYQAISGNGAAILRYVQPWNMTSHEYANGLVAKFCNNSLTHATSALSKMYSS